MMFMFLSEEERYLANQVGYVVRPTSSQQEGPGFERIVLDWKEDVARSVRVVVVDEAMQKLFNRCLWEQAKRRQLQQQLAEQRAATERAKSASLAAVALAAERAGKASPTPTQG